MTTIDDRLSQDVLFDLKVEQQQQQHEPQDLTMDPILLLSITLKLNSLERSLSKCRTMTRRSFENNQQEDEVLKLLQVFASELAMLLAVDPKVAPVCTHALSHVQTMLRDSSIADVPDLEAIWTSVQKSESRQPTSEGMALRLIQRKRSQLLNQITGMPDKKRAAFGLLRRGQIQGLTELRMLDGQLRAFYIQVQRLSIDEAYVRTRSGAKAKSNKSQRRVSFASCPEILGTAQVDVDRSLSRVTIPNDVEMLLIRSARKLSLPPNFGMADDLIKSWSHEPA